MLSTNESMNGCVCVFGLSRSGVAAYLQVALLLGRAVERGVLAASESGLEVGQSTEVCARLETGLESSSPRVL